jgi:hypothetical protein
MTHTEIILGNLLRLDNACTLKDGRLNLKIIAPYSVEPEKLKVSVKAFCHGRS